MLIQKLLQEIREHKQMLTNAADDDFRDKVKADLSLLQHQLHDIVNSLLDSQEQLQNCMAYDSVKNNTIFTTLERIYIAQVRASIYEKINYINGTIGVDQVRWHIKLPEVIVQKVLKIIPNYEYDLQ